MARDIDIQGLPGTDDDTTGLSGRVMGALGRTWVLLFVVAGSLAACGTATVTFPNVTFGGTETPRPIHGLLAKPAGPGPFPAVVLLHTCGGVQPHVSVDWPRFLTGLGYVTLTVDSFGSRGLGHCSNALHPAGRAPKTEAYHEISRDAYGAFDWLARQPWVRGDRIAVIGFSLGANVINSDLIRRSRPDGATFRAGIGMYGRCHDLRRSGPGLFPLMEVAGALDAGHVEACRAAPPPIEVHVIPGAHHSWDDPQASGKRDAAGFYMQYDRAATEKSRELVRHFLARHLGR